MYKFICVIALLVVLGMPSWGIDAPVLAVPQVDVAPTLDGRISTGEWAKAAVTSGFREYGSGYPAIGKTIVSVCYDNSALYVLFRCYGEDINKIVGALVPRDSPIWNDSEVETFIVPVDWTGGKYAHFIANCAGSITDEMDSGSCDSSWNPEWKCSTGKESGMWFAEMAIPWSSINTTPKTGTVMKANFGRNAITVSEVTSWSHVAGAFHQPHFFGSLVLVGKKSVVAVSDMPGRGSGEFILKPEIIGDSSDAITMSYQASVMPGSHSISGQAVKLVKDTRIPIVVGYGTKEISFKATDNKKQVLWQQSVKVEIPDLPARIASLEKSLAGVKKRSSISDADAQNIASKLDAMKAQTQQKLDTNGILAMTRAMDAIDCRLSDLSRLISARRVSGKNADALSYFVTNPESTFKVQPNSPNPGPLARELKIAMAKAEYEPVQFAVCPVKSDLKGIKVTTTSLNGPNGAVIPVDRVVITPIASVICKASTSGARLKDEIPDVLLPNRPMDVAAGRRQPFFVTVQSTSADVAGTYHGTVTIAVENSITTNLPLTVRVYNVTLPVKSGMRTAFVLWGTFKSFMENSSPDAYLDTYIRYSKMMLTYRISPITMWSPSKDSSGNWDFTGYNKYLSAVVPFGLTTLNIGGNGEVAGAKNADFVVAAKQNLKSKGWWDLAYIYGYDEAPGSLQDQLVANYKALVDAVPDAKVMQTGWSPADKLKGLVKIWCPLTANADLDACYTAQKAGDEAWWYVCCGPTAPYANLFVDYPGIDHRMLGWMTYKYKITGLLYWGVDVWPNNKASVDYYDKTNYADWDPNSFGTVMGDGYLLYPGRNDSPVASMRLALLRDGIEDYDLFKAAEALAVKKGNAGNKLKGLLNIDPKIIKNLMEFNQNGNDMLKYREAILKETEALNK